MDFYTTDIQVFNDTTPKLPKTPLYQEVSEDFGFILLCIYHIDRYIVTFCIYVIVFSDHINTIVKMDYQKLRDFK